MSNLALDETTRQQMLDFLVDHDQETAAKYERKMAELDSPPPTIAEQTAVDLLKFLRSQRE